MAVLEFIASILPFVAGAFLTVLACVVISRPNIDRYRAYFCLFLFSAALWSIGISIFLWTQDASIAYWVAEAYYVAALLVSYSLLVFARAIPEIRSQPQRRSFLGDILLLIPIVVCGTWILTSGSLIDTIIIGEEANTVTLNIPYYLMFAALFSSYALAALYILYRKYRSAKRQGSSLYRVRLRLLAVSIIFGMLFGMVFNLILPFLGYYVLIWLGPIGMIPSAIIFWYAILRHGLFDIKLIVTRTIAYFLLFGTLIALYAALALTIGRILVSNTTSSFIRDGADMLSALILAFSFKPLQNLFNKLTYRLFFKNDYSVSAVQQSINETLATHADIRPLATQTINKLRNTIGASFLSIVVYDGHRARHFSTKTIGLTQRQKGAQLVFARKIRDGHSDTYTQGDLIETVDSNMDLLMAAHRSKVAVAFRLRVREQTIGVLMLGIKSDSSSYTDKDYLLLTNISEELALALQNALRLSQITDFSNNLQHKVDSATRELRASNQRLKALDDAKDEFLSMASHQLRTPLTSVKGYISMILDGDAGPINDQQRKFLTEAFSSSNRMAGIIGDFLNVSRLQTGKFGLERESVDLGETIANEVEHLQSTAAVHGLKLEYHRPAHFPRMQLDQSKIEQVVMNFIDNAIFYAPNTGTVDIELFQRAGRAVFTVHDHGIGVPKSEQASLFTKFFRATNARQKRPDGTGVGLFLAKKVVVAHKGAIIFDSEEGKGSTFGFEIPLTKD